MEAEYEEIINWAKEMERAPLSPVAYIIRGSIPPKPPPHELPPEPPLIPVEHESMHDRLDFATCGLRGKCSGWWEHWGVRCDSGSWRDAISARSTTSRFVSLRDTSTENCVTVGRSAGADAR